MDALSNVAKFFNSDTGSGLLKIGEAGTAGAGLIGNMLTERARSRELSDLRKQESALPDAQALARQVAAATQPLNRGLVEGVENSVNANLAEQGLSQAPGIQAQAITSALAPYEQQNQQTALQIVMQRLGLPLEYAQAILRNLPQSTNLAPILALLSKSTPTKSPLFSDPNAAKLAAGSPISVPTTPSQLPDWLTPPPSDTSFGDANIPTEVFG